MEKTGSGFYIIDAFSLRQASKKPFHLEKRFLRNATVDTAAQNNATSLAEAEVKREALLEARRQKLNRKFLAVQKAVKEVEARKESQRLLFLQSLQVAESKRNNHIEQRRAASKELVERAKIVARQNILRYEAEQERLRSALENRLKQSHARRLHMLSQPKSKILVTGSEAAARRAGDADRKAKKRKQQGSVDKRQREQHQQPQQQLQRQEDGRQEHDKAKKKKLSWQALLSAFRRLGLPSTSMPETWLQFNHLGRLLRNKRVIQVTYKILNGALSVTDKDGRKRSRVLLSAYMMTMCPREVFQDMHGAEEQQLLASAKRVLQHFEQIVQSQEDHLGSASKLAFEQCWNGYYALFESWKSKDMKQLVANMSAYCIELVRLKQTLGKQGEEEGVSEQLDQQILQVKDRIRKVGGPSALEHLTQVEQALNQPTETAGSPRPSSVPPSPTPRPERSLGQDEPPSISTEQLNRLLGGYAPVSGITNQQLAHEIIIDPDFKLQRQASDAEAKTLEQQVRKIATQAFFDAVEDDIKNGLPENSLPTLLGDIRQRLLGLVRSGSSLHTQISEALDVALIEQQTKQKIFDLDANLQYVLQVMRQICAPVRDEAIEKIGHTANSVHQLRAILEMLDEMALDLGNFRLRSLRPHLIPVAVEYERSKFGEALAKGEVGLAKTRTWLQAAKERRTEVANERNPENVPSGSSDPSTEAVFEEAFISLLTSPEIVSATWCPETVLLDVERITRYQNEMQSITIVAALVMLAKNFGHLGDLNTLAAKLFVMLEDGATTIDNLALEIERSVRVTDEQRRPIIRAMVDKTVSHSDTVYSLLMRRVASVVRTQLNTGKFATREVLASYGLECVRKTLEQLCVRVMVLGRHHLQVYSPWYNEMLVNDNDD